MFPTISKRSSRRFSQQSTYGMLLLQTVYTLYIIQKQLNIRHISENFKWVTNMSPSNVPINFIKVYIYYISYYDHSYIYILYDKIGLYSVTRILLSIIVLVCLALDLVIFFTLSNCFFTSDGWYMISSD